jgi:hypothetical protein
VKEASQFRRVRVNDTLEFKPSLSACVLPLSPSLRRHSLWAFLDPYQAIPSAYAGTWTAKGRIEFFNAGALVGEMRVDRGTNHGLLTLTDWVSDDANYLSQICSLAPSGGNQPVMQLGGAALLTVASFEVTVEASEARLFVESITNNSGSDLIFAVGLKILSFKP